MNRWLTSAAIHVVGALGLVAALVLVVALNLIADRWLAGTRLDLTEDRRHTLSAASREVLAAIDEPIELTLYYSEAAGAEIPLVARHAARVRDLLDDFVAAADGRLSVAGRDPAPFTAVEDEAVAAGLTAVPISDDVPPLYLGLVGRNSVDDQVVLTFLTPDRAESLEYDLSRLVRALTTPQQPVVGVLSQLAFAGRGQDGPDRPLPPFALYERLSELFVLRDINPMDATIDDDVEALMVIHPHGLPRPSWYAVDQFMLSGRPAVMFVDPLSEADVIRRTGERVFAPAASGFGPLGDSLGLRLAPRVVVGDPETAMEVDAGSASRVDVVRYLPWLDLGREHMAGPARIHQGLRTVSVGSAGILETRETVTAAVTPLLSSSAAAGRVGIGRISVDPDPRRLLAEHEPEGAPQTLAVRLTGTLATAFPDGPPEGTVDAAPALTETDQADVVVVADTDILDDRFWTERRRSVDGRRWTPVTDNDAFIVNILELQLGIIDLSGLRGRSPGGRPFSRLRDMERSAETLYRQTELDLIRELEETETELATLMQDGAVDPATVTAEWRAAREQLSRRLVETRQELRAVRVALREDVETLEQYLVILNVSIGPILLGVLALGVVSFRALRRRRRPA